MFIHSLYFDFTCVSKVPEFLEVLIFSVSVDISAISLALQGLVNLGVNEVSSLVAKSRFVIRPQ